MATFNPQFQSQDPNYWFWARSGQPERPIADTSTGKTLETIGNAIEGGAALADTAVKQSIKDEEYTRLNQERDDFSRTLDTALGNKPNPLDANAAATDQDLMPDKGQPVPQDVTTGLQKLQTIQNAKQYSGKVRTTDLDTNASVILKDLRSRYPGYRDYIDQTGSSIMGYNVANKLVQDKIAQLNELRTNAQAQSNYWERQIVNSGMPGANNLLDEFHQTGNISKVQHVLASYNSQVEGVKQKLANFELASKTTADLKQRAEDAANSAAGHAAIANFYSRDLMRGSGDPNDPTIGSSYEVSNKIRDLQLHPENIDPNAVRNLGMQLQAQAAQSAQQLRMMLVGTKTSDGQSVADVLGPQRINEIVQSNIDGLYKRQLTDLSNGDIGLVHAAQNAAVDRVTNVTSKMLADPSIKQAVGTMAALSRLGVSQLSPEVAAKVIGGGQGDSLAKFATSQSQQAIAQTGGTVDKGNGVSAYTFRQALDEQKRAAAVTSAPDVSQAAAIKSVLELHKALTEKNPQVVDNAATFFYDPNNEGVLKNFAESYYDPTRRVTVKGRSGAFQDLTSPDITKSLYKRRQDGNETPWDNYKAWATKEAAASLTGLAATWANNAKMEENNKQKPSILDIGSKLFPGSPLDISQDSLTNHHFTWNTKTHEIGLTDLKGKPIQMDQGSQDQIRNANIYLKGLTNIARQEGADDTGIDSYLLQTLQQAWPRDETSQRIFRAIASAYPSKEKK